MKKCLLLFAGVTLLGCANSLKPVELVEEPRVLGARAEVDGEPARAAPAPGESARVSFLLASPDLAPESFGFALSACVAAPRLGSRSDCASSPFARGSAKDVASDGVNLSFTVPSDADSRGRVALLGIICPGAAADETGTRCLGDSDGLRVELELELAREADVNSNPELQADSISFDGASWATVPAAADCAGLGLPEVAADSEHRIAVEIDETDRDALPRPSPLDPARESLQLSHFTTAGSLSRAFENIAWDSFELKREVSWTAPRQPGLVRFWLVLRDFRGGSDFVERAVCVL